MAKTLWSEAQAALVAALVEARKAAGMSQASLAQRLRCQQSLIARIESGERRIDMVEFSILSRALGADSADILRRVAAAVPPDGRT